MSATSEKQINVSQNQFNKFNFWYPGINFKLYKQVKTQSLL